MKKCSTPVGEISETNTKEQNQSTPRAATLSFLRQFARVYRPAPSIGMPGIVLN